MPVQTQLQQRRGTAASWTSTNPTLAAGEIGFETDTGKFKIGNGSTAWASLAYTAASTAVTYLFNATSGQTTFSGADANGLTLAYTVGAEQVYLNGVLQVRGSDYTATNGTSIVLTSGALTSDVLNVIAYSAMTITDTYTQAQADAKFLQVLNTPNASNPVLNSSFQIWQRGTSPTWIANNAGNYQADRWLAFSVATGRTVTRETTNDTTNLPNIQYCARVQRTAGNTATDSIAIMQNMETINSIPFAGKTVTFSFYARAGANYSSASNGLFVRLASGTGTDQNFVFPGYTGSSFVVEQTATLTTTWQRFTYTATVATTATELCPRFVYTPVGTAGAADYFEITGVQLEVGSVATPFRTNGGTIAGELAACQRYYWRNTAASNNVPYGGGYNESTTFSDFYIQFPQIMRTSPSAVEYSTLQVSDFATFGTDITNLVISASSSGPAGIILTSTVASGLTAQRVSFLRAKTAGTSYLGFSAEL